MKARDIMNQPVLGAAKTATARDVAIQILMGGFSGMPITGRDGSLVGIVEDGQLVGLICRPDVLRAAIEPKFMRFS